MERWSLLTQCRSQVQCCLSLLERCPHLAIPRQVYRHMDVGSAKVDPVTCGQIPHHLLDVVDVTQPFNAGEYYKHAVHAIEVKAAVRCGIMTIVFVSFSPFCLGVVFPWSWGVRGSTSGLCYRVQLVLLPPPQSPWNGWREW